MHFDPPPEQIAHQYYLQEDWIPNLKITLEGLPRKEGLCGRSNLLPFILCWGWLHYNPAWDISYMCATPHDVYLLFVPRSSLAAVYMISVWLSYQSEFILVPLVAMYSFTCFQQKMSYTRARHVRVDHGCCTRSSTKTHTGIMNKEWPLVLVWNQFSGGLRC